MKTKLFILILTGLILNANMFAQKGYTEKINQLNEQRQKYGLWVDSTKYRIRETYYKNGVLSGICKVYNTKGRLLVLGEYQSGLMSGTWFYFKNTGHLWFIFKDFAKNTDTITNEGNGKRYVPDYKCYSISYYSNGNKQDEGTLLWSEGESPESDFSVEYGEWKYYDEDGSLAKTKTFK